ncbi:MAG: hypothetical protein P8I83_12365 [Paracoccaceae bacterium]|nr:hypothetical protein [Paracoccaceae bacterium]
MAEKQSVAGLGARPRKQLNSLDNFKLTLQPEVKEKTPYLVTCLSIFSRA